MHCLRRLNINKFFLLSLFTLLLASCSLYAYGEKKRKSESITLSGTTEAERLNECAEKKVK